jgi:DNA-binding response OmpR family regulator
LVLPQSQDRFRPDPGGNAGAGSETKFVPEARAGHAIGRASDKRPMKTPRHILIAGGEMAQRAALAEALAAARAFRVSEAANAFEALARAQLRSQRFDAIIVDNALPDSDGADLCARMRRRGVRVPIVVLSDFAAESEIVRALDAGANDYVTRPFRLAELAARLRAQIREHDTSEDAVLLIGPYHFRPGARTLHEPVANVQIRLTQKEVTILKCLYRAAGRPVSRQTLLQQVWGYSSAARTHTVETHIYRLRRKIEPDPVRPTVVVNDGGGYSLGQHEETEAPWHSPLRVALAAVK